MSCFITCFLYIFLCFSDSELGELIMNVIQSECEISDRIDGFSLSHSIAGGTGSGLGSWILEKIVEEYAFPFYTVAHIIKL